MRIRTTMLAVITLVVAACTNNAADPAVSSTTTAIQTTTTAIQPTTTALPATTTSVAPPSEALDSAIEDALAVKDAFFISFNSADAEAVMGLFSTDASFVNNFGPITRTDFEELLMWNMAQGTRYTPSDCDATPDASSDAVRVSCPFKTHDVLTLEVGAPPVPFTASMEITQAGIVEYRDSFGDPDFNVASVPFERWMNEHHPEDAETASFGSWNSIEETTANGVVRADYAELWAEYLDTNGCRFQDNC